MNLYFFSSAAAKVINEVIDQVVVKHEHVEQVLWSTLVCIIHLNSNKKIFISYKNVLSAHGMGAFALHNIFLPPP